MRLQCFQIYADDVKLQVVQSLKNDPVYVAILLPIFAGYGKGANSSGTTIICVCLLQRKSLNMAKGELINGLS